MNPALGRTPVSRLEVRLAGGLTLPGRVWPREGARALIAIVHGIGEHSGRYAALASDLVQAGFTAAACASCHTTTTWTGATFNHDTQYFRIYLRGHATRWTSCTNCHTSATNFASFNCLGCHPHSSKAITDGNHSGNSAYRYTSTACYSCHTR